MKKNIALSVLALSTALFSVAVFADDTIATEEVSQTEEMDKSKGNIVASLSGAVKKTVNTAKGKVTKNKADNDDSIDAESSRNVSDTSITIFSQNKYIQSIMEKTTHIKSARLKELIARGDKVTMLDIRPRSEFIKTPSIKGVTINIPRNFLEVEAYEKMPNKDASIIIISTKGIRGGLAANTLQNMGYTNVRNLMDGLQGWNKSNN